MYCCANSLRPDLHMYVNNSIADHSMFYHTMAFSGTYEPSKSIDWEGMIYYDGFGYLQKLF